MKKQDKPSISFFCPAFNEEENLPILIPKTYSVLKSLTKEFEIVIIDNASTDNTAKVADGLCRKYSPQVKVIHHNSNRDYGGALRSGFLNAKKYPYVFYTDGDNQYDVSVLREMLKYIDEYDAVFGKRKSREINFLRKVQSISYNGMIRLLFNVENPDINCAIRLIKRKALQNIHLSSNSSFLPAEMMIGLAKQGKKVKYVEVEHYPRVYGKATGGNLNTILPTFLDMLKFFLRESLE